jgi:hypothetical protein
LTLDATARHDVPLYEVVDKKTIPDSNNDYSSLSVSTLIRIIYYVGTSFGEPVTSEEVMKPPIVTNYRRMVCCLAVSAGVAILFICHLRYTFC